MQPQTGVVAPGEKKNIFLRSADH